jgi:RNA polymerase sigma-70 factor, ECF subfamily
MLVVTERAGTFEQFFRVEYPRLVPMLRALTGDRHRAEDIAQEALAKAQQDWARVSGCDKPGAWVRRVALNASSNTRRRRAREVVALRRLGTASATVAPPASGEPDEVLWRWVRQLPEQQRWAVALYYVEDRSIAEVAEVLGCSEGAVKTHLSRARATLARRLGQADEEMDR